jgi:hypothetical protein
MVPQWFGKLEKLEFFEILKNFLGNRTVCIRH